MAKTMNIFISLPMARRDMRDIEKERQQILEAVKKTSLVTGYTDFKILPEYLEYGSDVERLGNGISQLDDADLAIFAHGWEDARGCTIEHEVCVKYGIDHCDEEFLG